MQAGKGMESQMQTEGETVEEWFGVLLQMCPDQKNSRDEGYIKSKREILQNSHNCNMIATRCPQRNQSQPSVMRLIQNLILHSFLLPLSTS
jgi:hypothetical protein